MKRSTRVFAVLLLIVLVAPVACSALMSGRSNAASNAATARPDARKAAVHSIGGCQIFPANNWWNTKIKDLKVTKRSKAIIRLQAAGNMVHLDLGTTEEYYGVPINVAVQRPADRASAVRSRR